MDVKGSRAKVQSYLICGYEYSYCRTILTEELASLSVDDEIISGRVRGKCVFPVE